MLQESLEKKNENHIRAFESIMNAYLKKNTDRMNKLKLTIMKSVIRKKLKLATNIIVDPRDYRGIMSLMKKAKKVDDLNSVVSKMNELLPATPISEADIRAADTKYGAFEAAIKRKEKNLQEEVERINKTINYAYFLWMNAKRASIRAANPSASLTEVAGAQWKAMAEEEKTQWKEKADKNINFFITPGQDPTSGFCHVFGDKKDYEALKFFEKAFPNKFKRLNAKIEELKKEKKGINTWELS